MDLILTSKNNIEDIILAFLNQDITPDEMKTLKTWIEESSENLCYFEKYQHAWTLLSTVESGDFNKKAAFKDVMRRIKKDNRTMRLRPRFLYMRYAAVAAVVFALGMLFTYHFYGDLKTTEVEPLLSYKIDVPQGSRMQMELPDGTKVWIGADSHLEYSNRYGVSDRKVSFSGEAFFDVAKNKELPFSVKSGDLQIEVLGTKFNFQSYEGDEFARAWLCEGAVRFTDQSTKQLVLLDPGECISYDRSTKAFIVSNFSNVETQKWENGVLVFNEEKFKDIIEDLKRVYNVNITFENEALKNLRFYGDFSLGSYTIWQVLDVMSATHKFKYRYSTHNNLWEIY